MKPKAHHEKLADRRTGVVLSAPVRLRRLGGFAMVAAIVLLALAGCAAPKPLKPGQAIVQRSEVRGQKSERIEMLQSENPHQASSQRIERSVEFFPVFTPVTAVTTGHVIEQAPRATATAVTPSRATERIETTIGAAQKDTSREIAAKLAAMRPALWVGIGLILVAGAFLYFQWWTPAAISAATGVGLMLLGQAIATHTTLLLVLAVAAAAIFAVFRAYEKGQLDKTNE